MRRAREKRRKMRAWERDGRSVRASAGCGWAGIGGHREAKKRSAKEKGPRKSGDKHQAARDTRDGQTTKKIPKRQQMNSQKKREE